MGKADSWERASSETVAECKVFDVRRDSCRRRSDGKNGDFYVIESPDWVNVIAMTRSDEVVLIEQFRHGVGEMHLELPGGLIDAGENPKDAAARELLEETGYTSENWTLIGCSRPNPAIQNNMIYHYLALDCEKTAETAFDENESIETSLVHADAINELILAGRISHSLVVAAFLYYRTQP